MDRKAIFGHNVSGDNALYNSKLGLQKLSLDEQKIDLAGEANRIWYSSLEDEITKQILKVSKNNRFSHWQKLPFVWLPCDDDKEITDDETFGIPSSIEEFLEFKELGHYENTEIENITFKSSVVTRAKAETSEGSGDELWTISDTSDRQANEIHLQLKFSKFFTGYHFNMIPHESSVEKTFMNMFHPKVISEIREALKITVGKLFHGIPHLFYPMLRESQFKNWPQLKTAMKDYQKTSKKEFDLTKFQSLLRAISHQDTRNFRIESKMLMVRSILRPFFRGLTCDNSTISFGEFSADNITGKKERFEYNPFLNFLTFSIIMMGETHKRFSHWLFLLANKLNKRVEELDMYDILQNKIYLFEQINRDNQASQSIDSNLLEFAHKKAPDDLIKGIQELCALRKEGAKDFLNNQRKQSEKIFNIGDNPIIEDPESDDPQIEDDLYYDDESMYFFKRVDRKPGTKARRFGNFRNTNRDNRVYTKSRGPTRGQTARRSQNKISYNSDRNRKIRSNNNNRSFRRRLTRHDLRNQTRQQSNRFKTRYDSFKKRFNVVQNPGDGYWAQKHNKPLRTVSRRRFDNLRLLTDEMIKTQSEFAEFIQLVDDFCLSDEDDPDNEMKTPMIQYISDPESVDEQAEQIEEKECTSGELTGKLYEIMIYILRILAAIILMIFQSFKRIFQPNSDAVLSINPASRPCEIFNIFSLTEPNDDVFFTNIFNLNKDYDDILMRGINLQLIRRKQEYKTRIILDTGATSSLVPFSLVQFLGHHVTRSETQPNTSAKVAGGGTIALEPYRVSFTIICNKYKLRFTDALVSKTAPDNMGLMGVRDLKKNDLVIAFENGEIKQFSLQKVPLEKFEKVEILNFLEKTGSISAGDDDHFNTSSQLGLPDNSHISFNICGQRFVKPILRPDLPVEDFSRRRTIVVPEEIKTKVRTWNYPLGEKDWDRHIAKLRDAQYAKNTVADVQIDPKNEVLQFLPNGQEIKDKVLSILEKHKNLFRGDAGHVTDPNFTVFADINVELMGKSCPNYYASMPADVLKSVIEKFDEEIASGILRRLPHGVKRQHVLPVFPVSKKNPDDPVGSINNDKIAVNFSKVRLVADCSKMINAATTFRPTQSDSMRNIVQRVAKYTADGYIGTLDITQQFFSFPLEPKLWPFFCIEHPTNGLFAYCRLPMGWISSPSHARLSMMRMLLKYNDNVVRYLDDICLFETDPEKFVDLLDKVLATLWYYNLRLKGSKMSVFGKTIELLGKIIKNGQIHPNAHVLKNLDAKLVTAIVTKRQLKGFLGVVTYIADHLPYKAELTASLDKAASGVLADSVKWNDSLKADFQKIKDKCKELLSLHPVDPKNKLYLVVDSSYFATGGFLFQLGQNETKKFIKLFSRKRTGGENKVAISSCLTELNGIATVLLACQYEISLCEEKVMVYTDNKPVYLLWKRLQSHIIPSSDRRINNLFASLMNVNYEMVHLNNTTKTVQFADFLSREPEFSRLCPGCRICDAAQANSNPFETPLRSSDNPQYINLVQDMFDQKLFSYEPIRKPRLSFVDFEDGVNNPDSVTWTDPWEAFDKIDDHHQMVEDVELRYFTRFRKGQIDNDLDLKDLIDDKSRLVQWQNSDPIIREAIRFYENKGVATKKVGLKSKVRNLLEVQKAFVEEDLLKVRHLDNVREIHLIVLPETFAPQVVAAVHKTFKHGSFHRFKTEIRRYFSIKNLDSHIRTHCSQCVGCVLYSRKPKILKPIRNFDTEIPTQIGAQVLIDEITRTKSTRTNPRLRSAEISKTWKFLVASESLTRYSLVLPIPNNLTSSVLKSLLFQVKFFLGQGTSGDSDMIISMDNCSIHQALVDDPVLTENKIKISIRPRESTSKNHLAMLDGRISKMSRILYQHMLPVEATKESVARLTTRDYNQLPNREFGVRPADLFFNRDIVTQKPLNVSLSDLVERRKILNKASRDSLAKKQANEQHRNPLKFVPWTEGASYTKGPTTPLKIGDTIILDQPFDKSKSPPIFEICAGPLFPVGIDFDDQKVHTRKVGKNFRKFYVWRFDAISHVIPGRKGKKDIEKVLKAFSWSGDRISLHDDDPDNHSLFSYESDDENKLRCDFISTNPDNSLNISPYNSSDSEYDVEPETE